MDKLKIYSERIGEGYYKINHSSGLTIYVMELEGFNGTSAMFGTKYGSINTVFKTKADPAPAPVPEGIAHFLEHKLFENEDCQVFELFAKTGASANAYTSFDHTVYYFECTESYKENLEILLDFVQKPYFTQETVDKEQGIIGQEIRMCENNPYRRSYFNLMRALYKNHPVRIEIAGTVDSIAEIDAPLLYRCYGAFYNLRNMVLTVAGNCRVDEVLEVADRMLKPAEDNGLETKMPDEPQQVAQTEITEKMSVGVPMFAVGFKSEPASGTELLKKTYAASFILSMLFGPTSRFYRENSESGLINQSFGTETNCGEGYFMCALSGESQDPREVYRRINLEIESAKKSGLSRGEFEELKRARYGETVRSFNNVSACATLMLNSHLNGVGVFDPLEVLVNMTFEEAAGYLDGLLRPDRSAISVIEPNAAAAADK